MPHIDCVNRIISIFNNPKTNLQENRNILRFFRKDFSANKISPSGQLPPVWSEILWGTRLV